MRLVPLTRAKQVGSWTRPRRWAKKRREVWQLVAVGWRWQLVTCPLRGTWYAGFWRGFEWVSDWKKWPGYRGLFMLPKKKVQQAASEVDHLANLETAAFKRWAPLIAHVAATRYDDGSARKPGTITISVQGDMWCVTCNDVDTCKRVRALAPDVDKALGLASALVAAPETPWEDAPWLNQEGNKKKR